MTVYPGSLDYLYHNGVLNCIPYEAYSVPVAVQPSMNTNPYANIKQNYQYYPQENIGADSFIPQKESSKKNVSPMLKGLLAGGVLLLTLACILKGKSRKV